MRFRQRHRWQWLTLSVVAVLLAHIAVAQLTLAHGDGERGREGSQQIALVSASSEGEDDDEHEEEHRGRDHAEDEALGRSDHDEDDHHRGRDHPEDNGHLEDDSGEDRVGTSEPAEAEAEADGLTGEPFSELPPAEQGQDFAPVPAPDTQVSPNTQVAVNIANSRFQPAMVTVAVGGTVTWTSADRALHTATSDAGAFDSGLLRQGESFSQVFEQAGTFVYVCAFHDDMRAAIIVGPEVELDAGSA